jgi:anaerobic selenocysteine-containing dehydrogenase
MTHERNGLPDGDIGKLHKEDGHHHLHIPLINSISRSDWSAHRGHCNRERLLADEHLLLNAHAKKEEKGGAARDLYDHGVRDFHFRAIDNTIHTYSLLKQQAGNDSFIKGMVDHQEVLSTHLPQLSFAADREHLRQYARGEVNRPSGITFHSTLFHHYATYRAPEGGLAYRPSGAYNHHEWNGLRHADGSVELNFRGCAVDTDGRGAYRHPEDRTRQSHTSLRLSNGQSLDTDKENFFVLPPSVAKAFGIREGDLGWLVQDRTGKAVPVVFGDSGPENKLGEASVHALKSLGFDVNGRCGVEKSEGFRVVFMPHSGDGSGDIAGNPEEMARRLTQLSGTQTSSPI